MYFGTILQPNYPSFLVCIYVYWCGVQYIILLVCCHGCASIAHGCIIQQQAAQLLVAYVVLEVCTSTSIIITHTSPDFEIIRHTQHSKAAAVSSFAFFVDTGYCCRVTLSQNFARPLLFGVHFFMKRPAGGEEDDIFKTWTCV